MEILSVAGCPYEDHEGEILNLQVKLDEGEMLVKGGNISIEMMDDSFMQREVKLINPKRAGDYAEISDKAKQWKQSGKTLLEVKGPCICAVVVMNVAYHEVKTDEEIITREFLKEARKMVCVTPYKEINGGGESIYDNIEEGYVVSDKVIAYLKTTNPYLMSPGIYEHPFKKGVNLLGPYMYTDGYYYWDRDTWKYVMKYGLKIPQEFIDHVMSENGTKFMESYMNENDSWSSKIKEWNKGQGYISFLPDNEGNIELEEF